MRRQCIPGRFFPPLPQTAWGRGYCPCVRPSVRTDGSSPEASRPRRKKLCFFAKLKCGAATRGSQTRSATELALD